MGARIGWGELVIILIIALIVLGPERLPQAGRAAMVGYILQRTARIRGLIPTGGSDFHGSSKPDIKIGTGFGNLKIRDEVLDAVEKDYLRIFPPED